MASRSQRLRAYGTAVLVVALSTAISYAVEPYSELGDLAVVHLFAIVLLSTKFDLRVSVFACVLSILSLDFIYIPPRFQFAWTDAKGGLTFVAMMVVACVISSLTARLRKQEQASRASALRAEALLQLHVDLSTATEERQLVAITSRHLEHLLGAQVVILLGPPETWTRSGIEPGQASLAEKAWSRREQISDRSGDRHSLWMPLIGLNAQLGMIGVSFPRSQPGDPAQSFLLTACANQFVSATERVRLASAVHRSELEAEAERLRNSLLSAVSHDLKTPLTSIIAAGSALLSSPTQAVESQHELIKAMVSEGERLHRLINNLLSAARLDAPAVELRRSTESIEEIVAASAARFRNLGDLSSISLNVEPDLPFVQAEPRLLEQVLVNLIENAHRYSPKRVRIAIYAKATEHGIVVRVTDDGPGIPEEERDKVFEKFYRGQRAGRGDGGVGLGLTICRAIVRAHGGRIAIGANGDGGTSVEFTLPCGGPVDGKSELAS